MKPHEDDLPTREEELLDLLVDDELSDSRRRELFEALERKPGGWRRCALAFLEAQCWRKELRQVSPSSARRPRLAFEQALAPDAQAAPLAKPTARQTRHGGKLGAFLAVAASFLVALLIGSQIRLGGTPGTTSKPGSAGQADLAQVERSTKPLSPTREDPWRMVTLTSNDSSGQRQSVQLPAREEDHLDSSLWQPGSPVVPDDVLQALQASGHEIRQSRQFLPVPLQDGRKLVVPVDQVDVDFVGNRKYQ